MNSEITPSSANNAAPNRTASQIAEHVVGEVTWMSETEGYCECPGRQHHTSHNGRSDCALYLDHVPTLHCFHASCREAVEAKNRELRRAMAGDGEIDVTKPKRLAAAQKARWAAKKGGVAVKAGATETPKQPGRKLSEATKAKMRAAHQARWAKKKGKTGSAPAPATATGSAAKKTKRVISPEAKARMVAGAKKRWAKTNAAKKAA